MTKRIFKSAMIASAMLVASSSAYAGGSTTDGVISLINAGAGLVYVQGGMTGNRRVRFIKLLRIARK